MSSEDTEEELTSGNQLERYRKLEREIKSHLNYLRVIQHLIKIEERAIEIQHRILEECKNTSPHIRYSLQNCSTNIWNHQACLQSYQSQEEVTKHLINTFKFQSQDLQLQGYKGGLDC